MTHVAVFDVNVLFSAFGFGGIPFRCVQLAVSGQVVSVTCDEILADLEEKLVSKLGFTAEEAAAYVAAVHSFSRIVPVTGSIQVIAADPDDDLIVECAVVGGASHLITGDKKHLLPLGSYQGIQIVSPADFLALFPMP